VGSYLYRMYCRDTVCVFVLFGGAKVWMAVRTEDGRYKVEQRVKG
jgi:hypothetical protein